jgi:Fe-Mn family superoxide dismutase
MAQGTITAHEVPALPYAYNALEPHIDEQTMHLHHDKHHAAYVTKLNGAIEKHPELGSKSPEDLLRNLSALPEDVRGAIRNNGGGHVNHTMFWQIMGPKKGGNPTGAIGDAINKTFGSFDAFKEKIRGCRRKPVRQRLGLAGKNQVRRVQNYLHSQPGQSDFQR